MRTDIHKPSSILPADYSYVAQEYTGDIDVACVRANRKRITDHMANTGGTYSTHEHGGNCMICGSVNAIYTSLFYHEKSNSYVRVGSDCADKLGFAGSNEANLFRRAISHEREAQAGKKKAQAILADAGLSQAWDIFTGNDGEYEEQTIRSIAGNLVKYGSLSEKQVTFVRSLLARIDGRAARAAKFAAEREQAADCPTGRIIVSGTILKLKEQTSDFHPSGFVLKMLVKATEGYLVWVSVPSALNAAQGATVRFKATVKPSPTDPKFGIASRPALV